MTGIETEKPNNGAHPKNNNDLTLNHNDNAENSNERNSDAQKSLAENDSYYHLNHLHMIEAIGDCKYDKKKFPDELEKLKEICLETWTTVNLAVYFKAQQPMAESGKIETPNYDNMNKVLNILNYELNNVQHHMNMYYENAQNIFGGNHVITENGNAEDNSIWRTANDTLHGYIPRTTLYKQINEKVLHPLAEMAVTVMGMELFEKTLGSRFNYDMFKDVKEQKEANSKINGHVSVDNVNFNGNGVNPPGK